MIVGGCHLSYRFGEEDVILASCVLYLDIINLFWYILKLFGNREWWSNGSWNKFFQLSELKIINSISNKQMIIIQRLIPDWKTEVIKIFDQEKT